MTLEAAAAAVRSFSLGGALHRVAFGGPVFGFGEGPFTPLSCCLFPTTLLGLPVLLVLWLRLFSFFDCLFAGSQFSGGLFGHTQSTDFCLGTSSGLEKLAFFAVTALQ